MSLKKDTLQYELRGSHGARASSCSLPSDGTGVIAGGAMRAVLECAGVRNVLAKSYGSQQSDQRRPRHDERADEDASAEIAAKRGKTVEELFG